MLDSHIAPSTYSGRGTNWAALDHSRTKLEKYVLAEPPEHGKRSRIWGGLHKLYQKDWLDKDGDHVPTVIALWFCMEVVSKKQHDERTAYRSPTLRCSHERHRETIQHVRLPPGPAPKKRASFTGGGASTDAPALKTRNSAAWNEKELREPARFAGRAHARR